MKSFKQQTKKPAKPSEPKKKDVDGPERWPAGVPYRPQDEKPRTTSYGGYMLDSTQKTFKDYLHERRHYDYDDAESGDPRAEKYRDMAHELRHEDPGEYKRMTTPPRRYNPSRTARAFSKKVSKA